jgi:hypothetical protein
LILTRYGKGHTGYVSWAHLPVNHGFDEYFGYLSGAQSYTSDDRWYNTQPVHNDTEYSSTLYGEKVGPLACILTAHTRFQRDARARALSLSHTHTTHTFTHSLLAMNRTCAPTNTPACRL